EGRVVPLLWGQVLQEGGNVVWYGALEQDPIRERVKTGLWDKKTVIRGFRYRVGLQIALCRGPATIKQVIIGDTVVWTGSSTTTIDIDEPDLFGGDTLGQGGVQMTLDVFTGTTTQLPSEYLERYQDSGAGSDRTPRYTGTCYLVAR